MYTFTTNHKSKQSASVGIIAARALFMPIVLGPTGRWEWLDESTLHPPTLRELDLNGHDHHDDPATTHGGRGRGRDHANRY